VAPKQSLPHRGLRQAARARPAPSSIADAASPGCMESEERSHYSLLTISRMPHKIATNKARRRRSVQPEAPGRSVTGARITYLRRRRQGLPPDGPGFFALGQGEKASAGRVILPGPAFGPAVQPACALGRRSRSGAAAVGARGASAERPPSRRWHQAGGQRRCYVIRSLPSPWRAAG
jgi:hypothetical protein